MKGYIDIRRIKQIWTVTLFATVLCACSVEQDEIISSTVSTESAMEFTIAFPDGKEDIMTRTKDYLNNGDKAYVTAKVTLTVGDPKVESFILKYNGSRWVAEGAVPIWPANSVKATFTAYLLPQGYTLSMNEGSNLPIPLSSLKDTTDDPFMARVKDVPVNGIVPLQFAHTTTKLYVTGLKKDITEKVRFYNADPEFRINNQIEFSYSKAEGFTHKFTHDTNINNYIEQVIQKGASQVTFFLDVDTAYWGKHIEFRLDQVTVSGNYGTVEDPVKVKTTSLADRTGLRTMLRGRAYSMYFLDSQTNSAFIEEENWYKDTPRTTVFKSKEHIQAYFDGVFLSGGSLGEDLDFNFIDIEEGLIFDFPRSKAITLNQSLNGNHHTIRNIKVKNGLFNEIPSGKIIQNLRLENVIVNASGDDTSNAGLLAPVNYGTINNVRISGNNSITADNVSCVGGMVGINSGTITDSQIEGTLVIECSGSGLTVGGFVGDNGRDISGSKVVSASIISAKASEGGASVGGFVGINGSHIKSSSSNMHVDATRVKGNGTSNTGGFVGQNNGTLISCKATGDVKGGTSKSSVRVGGFAGYINSGQVDKCYATGYVYGHKDCNDFRTESFQIGGFGGYSNVDLTNCSSTGKLSLATNDTYINAGALMGLFSATSTIFNSFSVSTTVDNRELGFAGTRAAQVDNCHYLGYVLEAGTGAKTDVETNAQLQNSGRRTYSEWTSNSSYINGVPYLVK